MWYQLVPNFIYIFQELCKIGYQLVYGLRQIMTASDVPDVCKELQ